MTDAKLPTDGSSSILTLRGASRTNQIIRGALIQGQIVILIVFWLMGNDRIVGRETMLLLVGGAVWVTTVIGSFAVPYLTFRQAPIPQGHELAEALITVDADEQLPLAIAPLIGSYATSLIVVGALLEGGAMVNAILWIMNGSAIHLAMVLVSVVWMLIGFPTIGRLRGFLVQQLAPER